MADSESRDSSTDFFKDAVHINAVTYCESPDPLLELFDRTDSQLETMGVLVGNREEYQSSVNDLAVAQQLERDYRKEKLIVRLNPLSDRVCTPVDSQHTAG